MSETSLDKATQKIIRWVMFAVAAWAPIQVVYEFIHKGNLQAIGVTTEATLPHALFNLCSVTGMCVFAYFILAFLVLIVLYLLFGWRSDGDYIPIILSAAAILPAIVVIGLFITYMLDPTDLTKNNPNDAYSYGMAGLGAIILSTSYIFVFIHVKKNLKIAKQNPIAD